CLAPTRWQRWIPACAGMTPVNGCKVTLELNQRESRLTASLRLVQPHRGVVEDGAAGRAAGLGAGQGVDADPLLEGVVGPDPLDDDDAALQPVEGLGVDDDAALAIAEADPVALPRA